ncbi:bZIP transcription factor domain-containing protein [Phthorimaea operculella]|nr:bZIP transcription factor domain-containing protein [Phthorimaea operculella]
MNSSSMSVPTIKCEEASPSPAAPAGAEEEAGATGGNGGAYNLSVNLSAAMINLLAAETPGAAGSTLRTPEIVNDVITMTNPLDQYSYDKNSAFKPTSNDSNSSMSNSSATSPASSTTPPSIQKTCSELIKAGLKLSIESKRKMSGSDTDGTVKRMKREDSDDDYDSSHTLTGNSQGLTPEDEERRRRRRERNKIAATKCRLKKRERTVNLVTESEVLETQNIDLKAQLKDLEVQKRQLMDMLAMHAATCVRNNPAARQSPNQQYNMLRPYDCSTPNTFPTNYEAQSPYIRPESANILASSYTCGATLSGDGSIDTMSSLDTYSTPQYVDVDYPRADSVLSLPPTSEGGYVTTDGYLPKATNLLVPIDQEQEYYEPEGGYALPAAACHSYNATPDQQQKLNNGLNDGCLV